MNFSRFFRRFTPWEVFLRSSLICFLVGIVFAAISLRKIDRLPLDGTPLQFDGDRAFSKLTELSKKFPYRLPWHKNRIRAGNWLKNELVQLGLKPQEMVFSEIIAGQNYTDLKNIYAEIPGTKHPDQIVVMLAHYDTVDTTIEGAMDDASGVAVVLELAQIFSKIKPDRTLLFLFTDSEEFGAFWGARIFARSFDRADQIIAAANFDFVGPEKQEAILMLNDGLKQGYTPLWLRELALDSMRSVNRFEARDFKNALEFIQRAILIPAADHGAFLQVGIPSFNWVGQTSNFARQMTVYHHTDKDRVEIMRPESVRDYGLAAERLVRSLDKLPRLPKDFRHSSYLKLTSNLYFDGWAIQIIMFLAFIPFFLYSFSKFGSVFRKHSRSLIKTVLINETKNIAILFGSFLAGYLFMRLLPALKIVTQYESYPSTQKSELLYNPNFLAMLIVIGLVVLVYFLFRRIFHQKIDYIDYREIRHGAHAIFLAIVILLAFAGNPYLACLLLLPPAYFWTAIRGKTRASARSLNALLLIGGAVTLVIISLVMGTIFHVGVIYWYIFLAATYGLVSVYTVVLFFMAVTIMIRLARSFVFPGMVRVKRFATRKRS